MDEMTAARRLRADVPVPDHDHLTPSRQRLLDEMTAPLRGRAVGRFAMAGAALAVTAAALLSVLPWSQEREESAQPVPRPDQWVRETTRWDTWQCSMAASGWQPGEPTSLNLWPRLEPCSPTPVRTRTQDWWTRYDGATESPEPDSSGAPVHTAPAPYSGDLLPPQQSDALAADLPEDLDAALAMIRKRSIPTRVTSAWRKTQAQRDFFEILEVLSRSPRLEPDKAKILYRLITRLDGAITPVKVRDGAGRPVLAVGVRGNYRDYSYERNAVDVLLDPDTYAYRGIRHVAGLGYYGGGKASGGPFVAKGTVVATMTRVSTVIADRPER